MAGKPFLPARLSLRVFPESAGDFLGEGESKQPSPGEIQLENLILLPALAFPGCAVPLELAWLFHRALNLISGTFWLYWRVLGAAWGAPRGGGRGWNHEVLRCCSLFRGRLIQRGPSWYPWILQAWARPKSIPTVLQLHIHGCILSCQLLPRRFSSPASLPGGVFPPFPIPGCAPCLSPLTGHLLEHGSRVQEWLLVLPFPSPPPSRSSSRVFPCRSAARGSSASCSRT